MSDEDVQLPAAGDMAAQLLHEITDSNGITFFFEAYAPAAASNATYTWRPESSVSVRKAAVVVEQWPL